MGVDASWRFVFRVEKLKIDFQSYSQSWRGFFFFKAEYIVLSEEDG